MSATAHWLLFTVVRELAVPSNSSADSKKGRRALAGWVCIIIIIIIVALRLRNTGPAEQTKKKEHHEKDRGGEARLL